MGGQGGVPHVQVSAGWTLLFDEMQIIFYIMYGWFPVLLAIGSALGSGFISFRHRKIIHLCSSIIVGLLAVWALVTLYRMICLDEHERSRWWLFLENGISMFFHTLQSLEPSLFLPRRDFMF